jgi:hypothetical protein
MTYDTRFSRPTKYTVLSKIQPYSSYKVQSSIFRPSVICLSLLPVSSLIRLHTKGKVPLITLTLSLRTFLV